MSEARASLGSAHVPDGTREFLRRYAITDEVIDSKVRPDREGYQIWWDDGVEPFWLTVYAPQYAERYGRKANFPAKRGPERSQIGPNVLLMPDDPAGVLVVEGLKQQLAALSHAPDG